MGTGLKCLKIGQNNPVPICLRGEERGRNRAKRAEKRGETAKNGSEKGRKGDEKKNGWRREHVPKCPKIRQFNPVPICLKSGQNDPVPVCPKNGKIKIGEGEG